MPLRFPVLRAPAAFLCLAVLLTACGRDEPEPPHHGLTTAAVTSKPEGEAIPVAFQVPDGATYVATVRLKTDIWQRTVGSGSPEPKQASASAVMELQQTFLPAGADGVATSEIRLIYTEAEGPGMDAFLEREPITGGLRHDRTDRAQPDSLVLTGGTQAEQLEARDRLGGLYLAGFAGAPGWLPDHPVRVGEAWAVEGFLHPRGMESARQQARQVGLQSPRPTLSGTIRVTGVRDGPDGQVLELEIDALIEIAGPFQKGRDSGTMSYANQVRGTASVSARTGLPASFQATEVIRTDVRQGGARIEQRASATVHGTVTHTD